MVGAARAREVWAPAHCLTSQKSRLCTRERHTREQQTLTVSLIAAAMGIIWRHDDGSIAWFTNLIVVCRWIFGGFILLAMAVFFDVPQARALVPQSWLAHPEEKSLTSVAADILEYGLAFSIRMLFYSGLAVAGVVAIVHLLTPRKKKKEV